MGLRNIFGQKRNTLGSNNIIWLLTINDIFTWGISFVVTTLIGLYLAEKLEADPKTVVGIGTTVSFLARALTQIPFGLLGDYFKRDVDEVLMLALGNGLMGLAILGYTQVEADWQYYLLQAAFGIGSALNLVNWRKLFAKSLDTGKEGREYAIYDSAMSMSIAILGVLAGTVTVLSTWHFDMFIGFMGLLIIASNIWIAGVYFYEKQY